MERVPFPFIWCYDQLSCLYQLTVWDATQQQQQQQQEHMLVGKMLGSSVLLWQLVVLVLIKLCRTAERELLQVP